MNVITVSFGFKVSFNAIKTAQALLLPYKKLEAGSFCLGEIPKVVGDGG